jgi:hypothetical protein
MKQPIFPTEESSIGRSTWRLTLPVTAILVLAAVYSAQAHPGHSLGEHGAGHIVSSPYHISVLAGSGLVLWFAGCLIKRPLARRFLQAGGVAAVVLAGAWWGVSL